LKQASLFLSLICGGGFVLHEKTEMQLTFVIYSTHYAFYKNTAPDMSVASTV
jgi:hypothetical protein